MKKLLSEHTHTKRSLHKMQALKNFQNQTRWQEAYACMHVLTKTTTLSFLLSHHSKGLAKNACHRSSVEPMSFAELLPNFLPAGS